MKNKQKILIRVALFIAILIILLIPVNRFFQPVWVDWNNYNATYGFYEQPRNTIETLVLGASVAGSGIVTPELYNEYGINAYSICSQCQPVAASYAWVQEAHRLHGKTLKTIVFDASALRREPEEGFFHIAADPLRPTRIKYRAYQEFFDTNFNDTLSLMMPLYSYHDRWLELTPDDFVKHNIPTDHGTRGYHFIYTTYQEHLQTDTLDIRTLTYDENELATELDPKSLQMFSRMVDYCKENQLELILVRTPAVNWSTQLSQLIQSLADEHGLEYLDFNFGPLSAELNYQPETDSRDFFHLNYYGASKLTSILGRHLVEHHNATDVRGDARYAFMEEEYQQFRHTVDLTIQLHQAQSIADYLSIAAADDNTVLITMKDEAAYGLTAEERSFFAQMGLNQLANLIYRHGYIGVIQNGYAVLELHKEDAGTNTPLHYSAKLPDGARFRLISGSYGEGNQSSCKIKGIEHSLNMRGLNIVVYSNRYEKVLHTVCFDTNLSGNTKCTASLVPAPEVLE